MAQLNWTFQALEDLDEIGEYTAQYSPKSASDLIETILLKSQLLESFPRMGRRVG
ncbi:MAG: type II toxin-antitoxin system RelE/ParE family toxin [Bacteroidota bacterium]